MIFEQGIFRRAKRAAFLDGEIVVPGMSKKEALVHDTPRRGISTPNSQVKFPNRAVEIRYICDRTPSFTPTAGGG